MLRGFMLWNYRWRQTYPTTHASSAARLRGFEKDLNLKGQEFATLLSILYVGWVLSCELSTYLFRYHRYIMMQIPSSVLIILYSWSLHRGIFLETCCSIGWANPVFTCQGAWWFGGWFQSWQVKFTCPAQFKWLVLDVKLVRNHKKVSIQ